MCGRFTLTVSPETLKAIFGLRDLPELVPRYNIAPSQRVAAVRAAADGSRRLDPLTWGLIPSWTRDPASGSRLINARSETAAEKPAFRGLVRSRRCIIPASGFYEWQRQGSRKVPYLIGTRDGLPLGLAGLWDRWRSPSGEEVETCTILTTASNELLLPVHERMPVILGRDDYDAWLDAATPPEGLRRFLIPCGAELLEMYAVTDRVNAATHDAPDCLERR